MSTKNKKIKKQRRSDKKINFFSVMSKAIKDAYHHYKNEMRRRVEEHRLLSSKSDWTMIEGFIRDINENPRLHVDITLNDSTKIQLYCYDEQKFRDYDLLETSRTIGPEDFNY